jgi:hypothetical protein
LVSHTAPKKNVQRGKIRQYVMQLVYLFLSIDGGNSSSVMDSVSKMNRCPIQLKKCMITVAAELQKNVIW